MQNNLDQLFLSISGILGSRVTPENFRQQLKDINSMRGITSQDRTKIIEEILAYFVANENR